MCGILGVFGANASRYASKVEESLADLHHRGPDSNGLKISSDGICVLGHTRLSILELSEAGAQPMGFPDGLLSYNGEIYNHLDLRCGLKHDAWNGHSDTETLGRLLAEQGEAALSRLIGMFAGAWYNEREKRLLLFRDSLGIKPLYWCQIDSETIAFGSEVGPLLELRDEGGDFSRVADHKALLTYLTFENLPPGQSPFQGICPIKRGAILNWTSGTDGGVHLSCESSIEPLEGSNEDCSIETIRVQVEESVERHLLSDVPIACYMSGGLDSTTISAIAARKEERDLISFTGYFESKEDYYDERCIARIAAESFGVPLKEVLIGPSDFETNFDQLIATLEEPRMGMGTFSQFVVAKQVAEERRVVLAGHGGDELFGGYPMHGAVQWLQEGPLKAGGIQTFARTPWKQKAWYAWVAKSHWQSGQIPFAPFLFTDFADGLPDESLGPFVGQSKGSETGLADQLDQYYWDVYLPGLLLAEDRISMHHSLETRLPLCTQPLMPLLSRLPLKNRLKNGQLKGIWKEVIRKYLPEEVISGPKRGFPTPLRFWFREELKDFVRERLLETPAKLLYELVSRDEIESLLRSQEGTPLPFAFDERRAHRVWMLLVVESWFRQFRIVSLS